MAIDYFTRAEFREYANDPAGASERYSNADIDRAQAEVIERLEAWAHTAWPNVTGANGDGTAAARRATSETLDAYDAQLVLAAYPIVAPLTAFTAGDPPTTVPLTSYDVHPERGLIEFGSELEVRLPRHYVVTYSYGYTATPMSIKRPAMQATKTLLDRGEGRSGIPPNVRTYTTETATFEFDEEPDQPYKPWPWDESASRDVRSFWLPNRAPTVGAI